ncbi:MAG: sialate O-acetylesterase, partial [Verrucomicrobiota bacterium]
MKLFLPLFAILALLTNALAEIKLPPHFSDHMVLQRDMKVPLWGTADPGEAITVVLGKERAGTVADAKGKWSVQLEKLPAGGPHEMVITGSNQVTLRDVLVGEVWLCSGQSNMDFTVAKTAKRYFAGTANAAQEIAAGNHPAIRMFTSEWTMRDDPQPGVDGYWAVCSPDTVGDFSAVAYFFGRELQKGLKEKEGKTIPIGLITSAYGGSTAEAWISRPALEAHPELAGLVTEYGNKKKAYNSNGAVKEKYREAMRRWNEAAAKARTEGKPLPRAPKNPDPGEDQHNPSVLYNGMIAPLSPYAIRGVIWYQGESNHPTADKYRLMMETLIANWRGLFLSPEEKPFPFLFVQLANYGKPSLLPGGRAALVREAQLQTLALPNTAMVVAIDVGEAADIHPRNKQ